jgi:hypothetical protein
MGCGCGKKTPPANNQVPENPAPPTDGADAQISRQRGTTQTFTLQATSGRTQIFGSRLEAEAARVRQGGGMISSA